MKNLIFKEFKLSVHPLTYLMMVLISLASLSGLGPAYPLFLFGVFYTFLFIGIKKGVTNNDLYYSLLLPVRKEKVILARVTSTTFLQIIYLAMVFATSALALLIPQPEEGMLLSVGVKQPLVLIAVALLTYTIFDFIYLPWFYKKGKEVIWNMLIGTIVCAIFTCALCIGLAYVPGVLDVLTIGSSNANYLFQIGIFVFGIGIYLLGKFLLIKICTKEIKNLDF